MNLLVFILSYHILKNFISQKWVLYATTHTSSHTPGISLSEIVPYSVMLIYWLSGSRTQYEAELGLTPLPGSFAILSFAFSLVILRHDPANPECDCTKTWKKPWYLPVTCSGIFDVKKRKLHKPSLVLTYNAILLIRVFINENYDWSFFHKPRKLLK